MLPELTYSKFLYRSGSAPAIITSVDTLLVCHSLHCYYLNADGRSIRDNAESSQAMSSL